MSVNNWYSIIAEWIKNLFNMNKEQDIKALNLLERVLNDKGLGLEESAKVEARNVFLLSKLDGYLNRYALKEALLCASNENKKAYGKALKILERINNSDQAFMLELFTNTKVKKIPKPKANARTISAFPKHVIKKNDKPKGTKKPAEPKKIDKPKLEKKSKNIDSGTTNRDNKWRLGITIFMIALLIAALIIVIIASCKPQTAAVVADETTMTETTAPETTLVTVAETAAGNPKFLQVKGNNAKNRVDADFKTKYAEATQNATNLSDAQRKLLLDNSANNAFRLAIWSHAFGLYDDPNNWQPLVDGNYLSAEGEALYNKFEGAISAKGVIISKEKADKNGVNSG